MKTTLFTFLLFLSCNLMGQIDPRMESFLDTATYEISEAHEFGLEGIVFTNKDYINAKIDKRIMGLWKEYQIKCRNDSTVRYEDCSRNDGSLVGCYREIIIYKKPTFEGFMLFIEHKITNQ